MALAIKPSFIPTLKKATPAVAPVATEVVTEESVMEEAPVEAPVTEKKTRKKSEGERKTPNRQMNKDDMDFIVANVKTMSYTQMAEARGITKHQVNRVLMTVKKDLKEACGDNALALAKIEAYIKENLSRPEDTLPGAGGGRSSVVKDSINDIVGNILNSLK